MSNSDRALAMHAAYREASDKFDTFVLGATLTVCAFLGQALHYGPIGWNVPTIFLTSLSMFAAAAVAGFKRIEMTIVGYRLNHRFLAAGEQRDLAEAAATMEALPAASEAAHRWYRRRNSLLLLGFVLYVTGKLLEAYGVK
jgi:hypothetical protein